MRGGAAVATLERVSIAEQYVAALDGALVGPARVRRDLVREARDHLEDATAALGDSGYERAEAERIAVDHFGSLDEIVPAFQTTLAVAASRRTALMLLAVLSIQPFLWDGPFGRDERPAPDGLLFAVLDHVVEWGGALMIATAALLLLATGIGNRWSFAGRRLARVTALTALLCAALIVLVAIGMVVLSSAADTASWLMFLTFIVTPFGLTATQARRTLRLC